MKNKLILNKSRNLLLIIFTILSVVVVGTFAWFTWRSNDTALVLTIGELGEINITLAPYKISTDIAPSPSYEDNTYTQVDVVNSSSVNKYKVSLYYDIDLIEEELIDDSFKYTILSSSDNQTYTEYLTGNFSTASSNSKFMILENEELVANTNKYYRVYLWIDSDEDNTSMQGKIFVAELRAEYSSYNTTVAGVTEFNYTGDYQTFVVPVSGYYKVETWGAQGGGDDSTYYGGNGGYSSGKVYLSKDDKLYIYVGGRGIADLDSGIELLGGYNGGGSASTVSNPGASSGGGATDIRYFGNVVPLESDLVWNSSVGFNSRIIVAAGGGGGVSRSASQSGVGGFGGGLLGANGTSLTTDKARYGTGASQVSGGAVPDYPERLSSFGFALNTTNNSGSGGGGYYGGGSGYGYSAGGGGGSSFISGYAGVNAITSETNRTHTNNTLHYSDKYFIEGEMQSGVNSGDGKVKITYLGSEGPKRINSKLDNVRYIKDCINGSESSGSNAWNEIQAIYQGYNVAYGKNVTSTGTIYVGDSGTWNFGAIVDGKIDNINNDNAYINEKGLQCVTIDLEQNYNLDEIAVWHYYVNNGTYSENITYISSDGNNWEYAIAKYEAESVNGKRVSAYEEDNVDDQAPVGTLNVSKNGVNISASLSNVSDNMSGIKEYQYLIQTSSTCPSSGYTASSNNSYSFTATAVATYYVCARIKDNVGNLSEPMIASVNITTLVPIFTYTSSETGTTHELINDGNGNWRIKFYKDGTLTVTDWGTGTNGIDVFLVGGGAGGRKSINLGFGGGGGGGGYTKTIKNVAVSATTYTITIGNGGASSTAGGTTTAFNNSAEGGKTGGNTDNWMNSGGAGGSGGGGGSSWDGTRTPGNGGTNGGNGGKGNYAAGTGQGTNTYEFGETGSTLYSGGGGGGACGSLAGANSSAVGSGGNGGGGAGGAAATYYGGGGGGGHYRNSTQMAGGKGYDGIVVIRNKR